MHYLFFQAAGRGLAYQLHKHGFLYWRRGSAAIMSGVIEMIDDVFGEMLRFCVLTDDEAQKTNLATLIKKKRLTREDLTLVLKTIELDPDIYR